VNCFSELLQLKAWAAGAGLVRQVSAGLANTQHQFEVSLPSLVEWHSIEQLYANSRS
jgi:hypothetical protein